MARSNSLPSIAAKPAPLKAAKPKRLVRSNSLPKPPPTKRKIQRKAKLRPSIPLDQLAESLKPYLRDSKKPKPDSPQSRTSQDEGAEDLPLPGLLKASRAKIVLLPFVSTRRRTRVVEVRDEESVRGDSQLVKLYRKGIYNEDNDTDESVQKGGIQRGLKALKEGIERVRLEGAKTEGRLRRCASKKFKRVEGLGKGAERSPLREREIQGEQNSEDSGPSMSQEGVGAQIQPSHKYTEKSKRVKKE